MMGLSAWANIWIYLVANFAAGGAAALAFGLVNPAENMGRFAMRQSRAVEQARTEQ
jgi:hypothetical protein